MKIRFWSVILAAIASGFGFITLVGYFIRPPVDPGSPQAMLLALRLQFVAWASLLAAVAMVVGALNLLGVHLKKINEQSGGWPYSLFLILSLLGVILASAVAPFLGLGRGPTNTLNALAFKYIVSAVGTAISGLLVFFLVFAGYRLLRRRPSVTSITFIVVALISIVGMAPQLPEIPDVGLRALWIWIAQVPAVAGARGVLLGVALGIIATGLRVLLALDRPYGE